MALTAGMAAAGPLDRIQHIIVIYQENRSFDNLYGHFPGAEGLDKAGAAARQVDLTGTPYDHLPPVINNYLKPPGPDPRFPLNLPNGPFDAGKYVSLDDRTGDLVHRFYQEQLQIDDGKMDRFAATSDAGALTMAVWDGHDLPMFGIAQDYTLADHFFHSAFGGSFLNHFWLICACSPVFPNAPAEITAELDAKGALIKDGEVTPDFYAVNTLQPMTPPKKTNSHHPSLPLQQAPTIGDRLSDAGISWAWYSGGWADAVAGHPDPTFQYHHQPFTYFAKYAAGTPGRAEHLKDETEFFSALDAGSLPAVSFYKPLGKYDQHSGYADIARGDQHVADMITRIQHSPLWADVLVIVTYDENGGTWDHVAPPKIDRWGPGTRIPTIIVSPFARRHFVDHTVYDTSSILKTIENRWHLAPLATRDAGAKDLSGALQ